MSGYRYGASRGAREELRQILARIEAARSELVTIRVDVDAARSELATLHADVAALGGYLSRLRSECKRERRGIALLRNGPLMQRLYDERFGRAS